MQTRARCSGNVLIVSLVVLSIAVTLALSAITIASKHGEEIELSEMEMRAQHVAEAGVHRGIAFVQDLIDQSVFDPFAGLDTTIPAVEINPLPTDPSYEMANSEPLTRNGRQYGEYTVHMRQDNSQVDSRTVFITVTGYVPNAANPIKKQTIQTAVLFERSSSEVFDYAYFVNNWGWFYGSTIEASGNVRSNGQFDAGGYAPGVYGVPRYEQVDGNDLQNQIDDGGIYAGWDIVDVNSVRGMGGLAQNQYDFVGAIEMPNLNDLSIYEKNAISHSSSLSIGTANGSGQVTSKSAVTDSVLGDDPGEPENLVLIGTETNPIVLDGPVVVRGDVIISGYVTGQGSIYAGRNVYVADDVEYLNGPTSFSPSSTSEADTETWLQNNSSADFLGLFATEHIVMGDYSNSSWQSYVSGWVNHSMNSSKEDAGTDKIPNTYAGYDGIVGTEDDDVLEGDGFWTTETYSAEDALLGLIPAGFSIGDPIPGTGEDIDGDGQYDGTTAMSEFNLQASLSDSSQWAGNMPPGTTTISDLATITITDIHATLYTNHTAALVTLAFGKDFTFYGGLVSRNESIVYGTKSMNMIFDHRLAGRGIDELLPQTVAPYQILGWRVLGDGDVGVEVPNF